MKAHRRQFVIGPAPVAIDESWMSTALDEGTCLSYDSALPVAETRDRDGAVWHLIGIALQSDPARSAPVDEIAVAHSHEVEALTATWSGRWGLLGQGLLRGDACLFGAYYAPHPSGKGLLVSSSPALLHDQVGGDASPPLPYKTGMDWYPPPASRFRGIQRVLPSQVLAYTEELHPVRHRPLIRRPFSASYEETLGFLERSFRTILRNAAALGRPLAVTVTGGFDTRVLLAAAWREKLDFTTFTWDIPTMSRADRVLPQLLTRDAKLPHRVLERRQFNERHLQLLDEHTAMHTVDLDRELVPWGQYDELAAGSIVILGNLFAQGALYFYGRLPAQPDSVAASIEEAFGIAEHHPSSAAHHEGIQAWVEWIKAHPEPNMDWRDRFLWEQWGGGWSGAAEQGTEVVNVDCISPMNCEAVMAAVLSIDPAKRYGKRWQVDLTHRMAPFLTDHPYYLGGPLVDRFRRGASGWVHHPNKRRWAGGRVRSLVARTR